MNKKILILLVVIILVVIGGLVFFNQTSREEDNERKFVALGASTVKANNLSTGYVGDHPEYSFATGAKIESIVTYLRSQGKNLTAVNLAESGANSRSVLQKQVPNAVGFHPQYVVLDITADILESDSPDQLKNNLSEIVKKVKGKDTILLMGSFFNLPLLRTAPYPACKEDKLRVGFDKVTSEKILIFNSTIRDVARDNGAIFVDVFNVLGPAEVSDYDCVHPNIEGQKKLAQAWIKALKDAHAE